MKYCCNKKLHRLVKKWTKVNGMCRRKKFTMSIIRKKRQHHMHCYHSMKINRPALLKKTLYNFWKDIKTLLSGGIETAIKIKKILPLLTRIGQVLQEGS